MQCITKYLIKAENKQRIMENGWEPMRQALYAMNKRPPDPLCTSLPSPDPNDAESLSDEDDDEEIVTKRKIKSIDDVGLETEECFVE